MSKRTCILALLLVVGVLEAGRLRRTTDILIVSNSSQHRPVEPVTCESCDSIDVGRAQRPQLSYPMVIIDGHSVPGVHILGRPEVEVLSAIALARPKIVILATCYGAELGLLGRIFQQSATTEVILAAATTLPWEGYTLDEGCLAKHPASPDCFVLPAEFEIYTRSNVQRLQSRAARLLAEVKDCQRMPPLVRVYPHYLCLDEPFGRALFQIDVEGLSNGCPSMGPDAPLHHCGRSRQR